MNRYFIGIDSGTTSIKAVLFDEKCNEIDKKAFPLTGIFPRENQYEEDMGEIWEKLCLCVCSITAKYGKDGIWGIGITAQGDGLWLVDGKGEPVRNGCCFCDGRSENVVDEWVRNGTADKLFKITGTRIFTGNQNSIVKWMSQNDAQSLDKAKYFLHLKDYLFYKLTGEFITESTDQSLVLIDLEKREYSKEAFEICGIAQYRSKYPPLKKTNEARSIIQKSVAEKLGLSEKTVVTSGPMDVVACALASGAIKSGECCSIIGTAALHEMVISEPKWGGANCGMTVTHIEESRWLRLMASLAGTPNIEWMLEVFGKQIKTGAAGQNMNVYNYIEKLISEVPVGANGVMYHPYLLAGGERAPFTDSRARASYTGLGIKHTIADIARATYEGVAYAMFDCYQSMPQEVKSVAICGGGARSALWCQMFADVLGIEVKTIKGEEFGAKGAAMNNMVIQGVYPDYKTAVEKTVMTDRRFTPDAEKHREYMKYYKLFKRSREVFAELWKMRAELIER